VIVPCGENRQRSIPRISPQDLLETRPHGRSRVMTTHSAAADRGGISVRYRGSLSELQSALGPAPVYIKVRFHDQDSRRETLRKRMTDCILLCRVRPP